MLFMLELPVMLLGVYYSKRSAFISVAVYLIFCLLGHKRIKLRTWKDLCPHYLLLSVGISCFLGYAFYRMWIPYRTSLPVLFGINRTRLLKMGAAGLSLLSIVGVDFIFRIILADDLHRKPAQMLRKALHELYVNRYFVVLPVYTTLLIACAVFLRDGFSSPDSVIEGISIYRTADYNTQMSRRWAIRFTNLLSKNFVMHMFAFIVCGLVVCVAVILLMRLWKPKEKKTVVLSAVVLAAVPSISYQFAFTYSVLAYAAALLGAALSSYIILQDEITWQKFLLAALCLMYSAGNYQSYVGYACGVILITLLLRIYDGENLKSVGKTMMIALGMGITGVSLYFVALKICCYVFNLSLDNYYGLGEVTPLSLLLNLPQNIIKVYSFFIEVLSLYHILYGHILIAILAVCFAEGVLISARGMERQRILLFVLGIIVLPLAMNIQFMIVSNYQTASVLASYADFLMIVLLLILFDRISVQYHEVGLRTLVGLIIALYCWVSVLIGYAQHFTQSYIGRIELMTMYDIKSRVQAMAEYTEDTRVFLAGSVISQEALDNNPMNDYLMIDLNSTMQWDVYMGATGMWDEYSREYLGWNTGIFSMEETIQIINSEQLKSMACYPKDGSIYAMDDNTIIVKLDEPPYSLNAYIVSSVESYAHILD